MTCMRDESRKRENACLPSWLPSQVGCWRDKFLPKSDKTITQKVRVWNSIYPHLASLSSFSKCQKFKRGTNTWHPAAPSSETRNLRWLPARRVALPAPSFQQGEFPWTLLYGGQMLSLMLFKIRRTVEVHRAENIQIRAHLPQVHL